MVDFQSFWQRRGILNIALLPAAALFAVAAALRRFVHTCTAPAAGTLPPVIVVGNVVVGGSGKTPVVIALARALAQRGWQPGIICRGVGGRHSGVGRVRTTTSWHDCGDEALHLQRRTQLPVCFSRQRTRAAQQLAQEGCNVIVSDDGLQHAALPRTVEICVTDASYRFGNGWRLPAGPLRESPARAAQCTLHLLANASSDEGTLRAAPRQITHFYPLSNPQQHCTADFFSGKRVTALAGIARPHSFFSALERHGIQLAATLPLADHTATTLHAIDSEIILMTEKDAVKYPTDDARLYAAALECVLSQETIDIVEEKISSRSATP